MASSSLRGLQGTPPLAQGPIGWTGPFLVLDIETAPDRHAQLLARRQRGVARGSPLNEVVAASAMRFEERDGGFAGFRLRSWHRDVHLESDILANVEAELDSVADEGTLVTFNGRAHDLPMLRLRQMRWWQCDADAIPRIGARNDAHADLMLEMSMGGEGRWPSLSDGCAAAGFSLEGPVKVGRHAEIPVETDKCERDVVGTAILFMHVLAARRSSLVPLHLGLPAMGAFLKETAANRPHLTRLALSRRLESGAGCWGREPMR